MSSMRDKSYFSLKSLAVADEKEKEKFMEYDGGSTDTCSNFSPSSRTGLCSTDQDRLEKW